GPKSGRGKKRSWIFCETGLIRDAGMRLPGNGVLSFGSRITSRGARAEKSPARQPGKGTVGFRSCSIALPREVSKEKKKKLLFLPSSIFGSQTGPPTGAPGAWFTPGGRAGEKGLRARNQGLE